LFDTGKNTLHMVGLDEKVEIIQREKISRIVIGAASLSIQSEACRILDSDHKSNIR
jgi:hypothetical protein